MYVVWHHKNFLSKFFDKKILEQTAEVFATLQFAKDAGS
jgi:hypothetical protein